MTEDRDPYAVLQIASSAAPDEVAAAYRTLARRHHPDVSHAHDAEQRMAEINAAWTLLRDPARRAAWDRAHGITPQVARRPAAPAGPGRGGTHAGRSAGITAPGGTASPGSGGTNGAAPGAGGSSWASSRPAGPQGPQWRRGPNGEGAAGPPPGNPRGSVLPFGRHIGWSLGEIARMDPGYLVWLEGRREGAPYREEIGRFLAPYRGTPAEQAPPKKRRFR